MEIRSNNKAKHRSQKFAFGIFRLLSLCIDIVCDSGIYHL